jgi:hypothetical protein
MKLMDRLFQYKQPKVDTESRSQHSLGFEAAVNGKGFWENPHSHRCGGKLDFNEWFAGWCMGKRCNEPDVGKVK